jgi:transposase
LHEPYHSWICVVCLRFHPNSRRGRLPPSPHLQGRAKTVHSDFSAVSWAGIDVSQDWVDVAVVRASVAVARRRWERSAEGLAQLAEWLKPFQVRAAIVEPTGGLERPVGAALAAAGIAALRVNAKRIRDFARAHGVLAKTDALDAYALALFGERMQPEARAWLDAEREQLAGWIARQRQLVDLRTAERNRLSRVAKSAPERKSIQRTLCFFEKELERVEAELNAWRDQHGSRWQASEAQLRTMPGVGPKTARVLLAHLPELGRASRREIASLAGLAPYACESGTWRGQCHIRGGRAVVRAALYIASWTAVRRGKFRAIYEEMLGRGKPRQLALIAVARRMLVVLNEMMRMGRAWEERSSCA